MIGREKFDHYVQFVMSHLPNNLSEQLEKDIEGRVRLKLIEFARDVKDEFCEKNNLCPLCITGGWDCDSDHK